MALKMQAKPKTPAPTPTPTPSPSPSPSPSNNLPCLSPRQVEKMTGGAITYGQLKLDRMEAEANGTDPKIPYYRISYRKVLYKGQDIRDYLETLRVGA